MVSVALQEHGPPLEMGSGGTSFVRELHSKHFLDIDSCRMEVKEEVDRLVVFKRVTGYVSPHDRSDNKVDLISTVMPGLSEPKGLWR